MAPSTSTPSRPRRGSDFLALKLKSLLYFVTSVSAYQLTERNVAKSRHFQGTSCWITKVTPHVDDYHVRKNPPSLTKANMSKSIAIYCNLQQLSLCLHTRIVTDKALISKRIHPSKNMGHISPGEKERKRNIAKPYFILYRAFLFMFDRSARAWRVSSCWLFSRLISLRYFLYLTSRTVKPPREAAYDARLAERRTGAYRSGRK